MLPVLLAALGEGPPASLAQFNIIYGNIVGVILGFTGFTLFVLLITGGFQYITSGGEPEKAQGAKNTITWAIYGLVFIAIAFLIIRTIAFFALETDFERCVTVFRIYIPGGGGCPPAFPTPTPTP